MRIGDCMEEEIVHIYEICCFAFAFPVRICLGIAPSYAFSFLAITLIISAKSSASF
jgi:hypothetical protein